MSSTHNSIALLIDADNAPAAKIDFIISELASHGVVNIRRAYGNWKKPGLAGWEKVLHENSIQPMQSFDLVKGKNATDMALLIDAMDTPMGIWQARVKSAREGCESTLSMREEILL